VAITNDLDIALVAKHTEMSQLLICWLGGSTIGLCDLFKCMAAAGKGSMDSLCTAIGNTLAALWMFEITKQQLHYIRAYKIITSRWVAGVA
jgi:hypothetical protein